MDARLRELEILANIERRGTLAFGSLSGSDRDLAAFLVSNRYVNDLNIPWKHDDSLSTGLPDESELERNLHRERLVTLSKILSGEPVSLQITHSGRVRMAELRQTLRSGKLRDQFDILWDGRHFEVDLRVAVLNASEATPVAVAYLDLNGMKTVNDASGHDAGNVALRAYFHDISSAGGDRGDAYRLGGDEVGLIIQDCPREKGITLVRHACLLLQQERLQFDGRELSPVSIGAGLIVTDTPSAKSILPPAQGCSLSLKFPTHSQTTRMSGASVSGQ